MNNIAQFAGFSPNSASTRVAQTVNKVTRKTNLGESQHGAWGAFQAGMQVLQNYAGRSPANLETIAKSNLQLLHRSLLNDSNYAQSVKKARNTIFSDSRPSSHCVYNNRTLRADLLTLQPGTTIQLRSQHDSCAMYLSISGKPSIQSADMTQPLIKHWWDRYRQQNQKESLKNQQTLIISSQHKNKTLLTAEKKECILLRIQLPNSLN